MKITQAANQKWPQPSSSFHHQNKILPFSKIVNKKKLKSSWKEYYHWNQHKSQIRSN
jgi:hypothetical protein